MSAGIGKKGEQNQPLNFGLKTYISRFLKLISKYFVDVVWGNKCQFLANFRIFEAFNKV